MRVRVPPQSALLLLLHLRASRATLLLPSPSPRMYRLECTQTVRKRLQTGGSARAESRGHRLTERILALHCANIACGPLIRSARMLIARDVSPRHLDFS
jgi:hypothetical protein